MLLEIVKLDFVHCRPPVPAAEFETTELFRRVIVDFVEYKAPPIFMAVFSVMRQLVICAVELSVMAKSAPLLKVLFMEILH